MISVETFACAVSRESLPPLKPVELRRFKGLIEEEKANATQEKVEEERRLRREAEIKSAEKESLTQLVEAKDDVAQLKRRKSELVAQQTQQDAKEQSLEQRLAKLTESKQGLAKQRRAARKRAACAT